MDQIVVVPSTSSAPLIRPHRDGVVVAAVVLAAVVYQLCATMPTPATNDMINRLHTTGAMVGLTQAVFYLVCGLVAVIVVAYSAYSDRRRLIVGCLVVTCAGLVLAAIATNVYTLMLARAMQGASGATFPLALSILRQTLPAKKFGQATGIITAAYGGIAGVDSLLAGWLTDEYGFRAIFMVIAVGGIGAVLAVARGLPALPGTAQGRMDWWGAVTLCLGLIVVEIGVGSASSAPLASVIAAVGIGLVLLVVFWLVERSRENPLVPTRALRSRKMWPLLLTSIFTLVSYISVVTFTIPVLSQNTQHGYGFSATLSALLFLVPVCAINVLLAPFAGHLAPRIGWRRLLHAGLACMIPIQVIMALGVQSRWLIFVAVPVLGTFASGAALTAVNGLSVILSPKENPSLLPGVNAVCFGIGASLGIALAGQIVTHGGSSIAGFRDALWMSVGVGVLAFLVSLAVAGTGSDSSGERV